ncbi:MAG: bifunctional class I SAM-dependent methyltransferase/glycosyltransferase family 2 protein [Opitutaceae bacterium]|jgi:SAM-dependent methyltransferase|nr:bifunctional class I SAM-dependent methyltransferase/glycosyltransferase family 2 protein [Opitutaceae bacterium]
MTDHPAPSLSASARALREHFDFVAGNDERARRAQSGFHAQLRAHFRHQIPTGERVLEVGCGAGDLLAALEPSRGLGVDFSPAMIAKAQERHAGKAELEFKVARAEELPAGEVFDHIVLDYLTGYLEDIQGVLERLRSHAHARTRLHLTSLNTLWTPLLRLAVGTGRVMPQPPSAWLADSDLANLLELAGWEVVRFERQQLCPWNLLGLGSFVNRFAARLPGVRHLGATLCFTARPRMAPAEPGKLSCSVIVPARNESGNIRPALERIPVLGAGTEVIFVEGNSKDDTWETIQREIAAYDGPLKVRAMKQPGKGKWDAVFTGFAAATGDVLVIQDADLTAPPEDLPKFFQAIESGAAEFANGSRLVYPMESRAMRFLNLLGNKFFAMALSFVLGQPVKDSLCGTKMLLRSDYERVLRRIAPFGDFDPFGDFNLLYGSALLGLKIRDVPVRYKDRTYGETNISRFRHGWILLQMTWFGLRHLRCFPQPERKARDRG